MTFATPKFNAAVAEFKKTFATHRQIYAYGQFYVTGRTVDDMLGLIESELRANIRFMFSPDQLENTLKWFREKLRVDVRLISAAAINAMLDLIESNGDMAAIRAMFRSSAAGKADAAAARADFDQIWSGDAIPAYPYWSGSSASLGKALAARELEKDRCFQVSSSLARKVGKARALPTPPALSDGGIAGARVVETVPAAPARNDVGQQEVRHADPAALQAAYARMRAVIDARGFVQCGVLSGARGPFPRPEHYVLAIAHDVVDGKDAFLFWDPDANRSNIASTAPGAGAPGWGPGFGVLFATAKRLSTATDDADLKAIDRIEKTPLGEVNPLFGDHVAETRRHCYQVYSLQSLPLPKQVRVHTKVIAPPKHASLDTMMQNAIAAYAARGVEIYEASREEATEPDGDFERFRRLYGGFGGQASDELSALHALARSARGFGVTPRETDLVALIVDDLVPAALGTPKSPAGQPGVVLSAGATEWTLAHEIGHVLGLGDVDDPTRLMHGATPEITESLPLLAEEEAATIAASPFAV